jgi:hypothetical protein
LPWLFCKNFSGFQFHNLIQIDDIIFSNLVIIVFIWIFFLSPFCKSYHSFQSLNLITILFLFFMSILILISFFFVLLLNWFFFNFTIQLNIKFILYFIFYPYSFNCNFWNPFLYLKFFIQFHSSIFNWLKIELHRFLKFGFFKFNDSGHRFEKLKGFFLKCFIILFIFFIRLFQSHYLGLRFGGIFLHEPFFVEDTLLQHVDQKPFFYFYTSYLNI